MAHRPCRVAFVGAGYTAREHARAFRDCPGVELAGIQSRTRSRAEVLGRELGISIVCDSVEELYERTRADLVVVTVVELAMKDVVTGAFAYPWTVLMEKPPGHCVSEAEQIRESARRSKRAAFVAFNRRTMSTTIAMRDAAGRSEGKRIIKVQDQENPRAVLDAGRPKLIADHWMYVNSIHMVDFFTMLGRGELTKVDVVRAYDPKDPTLVVAMLEWSSGDVGLYEALWNAPGPWAVTVTVPSRRWELRPLEQCATQALGERPEMIATHPWDTEFKPGFRLQAELAVAAATGDPASDTLRRLTTLDDAIQTMRLIERIYEKV